MAPSNPSMLSPSPSPAAGTIVSPLTTTTKETAQESRTGDYTLITSRANNTGPGRSGRWTPDEKLLFLHGLRLHGRGRWKKIRYYLPTRTLIQIKSHAQKVLKREDLGDDVYLPLKANKDKVDALLKDKSKLYNQRINDPVTTLMSSDGRYHTISMQHETVPSHPPPQQCLPVVKTPLQPGYPSPYYNKAPVGNQVHQMPPYAFHSSGTTHPPDPMQQQQQQQQQPASAGIRYNHHHHNQLHSPMMHHHHPQQSHQQQKQQQFHYHHNHVHRHHPPQHGTVHHVSPPHPSPQHQHLQSPQLTTPPPPFNKSGAQEAGRMVTDAMATGNNTCPAEQQQLLPPVLHPQTPQSRKATTDALAAAALCELFRGEGKDLEQVSV